MTPKSANDAVSYPPLVYFDPSLEGWVNLLQDLGSHRNI